MLLANNDFVSVLEYRGEKMISDNPGLLLIVTLIISTVRFITFGIIHQANEFIAAIYLRFI
jgi:hypothetical protein